MGTVDVGQIATVTVHQATRHARAIAHPHLRELPQKWRCERLYYLAPQCHVPPPFR